MKLCYKNSKHKIDWTKDEPLFCPRGDECHIRLNYPNVGHDMRYAFAMNIPDCPKNTKIKIPNWSTPGKN